MRLGRKRKILNPKMHFRLSAVIRMKYVLIIKYSDILFESLFKPLCCLLYIYVIHSTVTIFDILRTNRFL